LYSTQHNKRVEEIESFRNRLGDESTDEALVMCRAECESGQRAKTDEPHGGATAIRLACDVSDF
jgi:hypothetical protein